MKRVFTIPNDVKKEYDKFIGFHIDELSHSKLTLLGLSKKITKSMLLRNALFQYMTEFKDSVLIKEIAEQAYFIWMANYKSNNGEIRSLLYFKSILEKDLRSRDLEDDLINKIVQSFEEIKRANETQK
jgi:hypothetical protein